MEKMIMIPESQYFKMLDAFDQLAEELATLKTMCRKEKTDEKENH